MTRSSLAKARLTKATLIVVVVTIAAFVTALILRELDGNSSPLLRITYETLGAVAGLGTAFVLVFVPIYTWQEHRKEQRASDRGE